MSLPDYYELLDVAPSVSQAELKKAYYQQAKKFHPDLNSGDSSAEERFKLIAEAYRILGDERERRLYDEARERELRYAGAPELAGMQRSVRFSVRRRRRETDTYRVPRRRFTFLPPRKKMPRWVIFVMCVFWGSALLPFFMLGTGSISLNRGVPAEKKEKPEPAAEVVRERLARMRVELENAAAGGDSKAQLRMGLLLYTGSAGVEMNRAAAREWWLKAAEQGNQAAAYYLEKCDFSTPAPELEPEPAPAAP